jgi:hypothetical protein
VRGEIDTVRIGTSRREVLLQRGVRYSVTMGAPGAPREALTYCGPHPVMTEDLIFDTGGVTDPARGNRMLRPIQIADVRLVRPRAPKWNKAVR